MEVLPPPLTMGISDIDAEHVSLINAVNVILHEFETQKNSVSSLTRIISMFEEHFSNEVWYMKKLAFPFIDTHKVEHGLLMLKAIALLNKARKDQVTANDVVTFAKDTVSHIEYYDVLYARYAAAMSKDVHKMSTLNRK